MIEEDVEDFLEHFGVKGMQWGVRKERRQRNRELNRASRARDIEKRDKEITKARKRLADSAYANRSGREAREEFRANRLALGSREARRIRREQAETYYRDYDTATQTLSGRETTTAVIAGVGAVAVSMLMSSAAQRA